MAASVDNDDLSVCITNTALALLAGRLIIIIIFFFFVVVLVAVLGVLTFGFFTILLFLFFLLLLLLTFLFLFLIIVVFVVIIAVVDIITDFTFLLLLLFSRSLFFSRGSLGCLFFFFFGRMGKLVCVSGAHCLFYSFWFTVVVVEKIIK